MAESVNPIAHAHNRGLCQFAVGRLKKVKVIAPWIVQAHNVMRGGSLRLLMALMNESKNIRSIARFEAKEPWLFKKLSIVKAIESFLYSIN